MKRYLVIAAFLSLFAITPVFAAEEGLGQTPFGDPTGGTNGGSCDFTAIKDSLYETESGGALEASYRKQGPMTRYGQARGRYQFVEETQNRMLSQHPECTPNGQNCYGANIYNQECWQTQECLMDLNLAKNLDSIRSNPDCQAIMGTTIQGKRVTQRYGTQISDPCVVTESGLAAAWHLGGDDACANIKNGYCGGWGDFDGNGGGCTNMGTSESWYICQHGSLPMPGQCTPAPGQSGSYDPGTSDPTLTLKQLESLIGQGDEGFINTGGTIKGNWVASLMLMAEQFTANMAYQLKAIGMFFDAKEQLEAQRDFQERVAEAHRDYHPSEQMCTFGTFSTNLASTQRRADLTRDAISEEGIDREIGGGDGKGNTGSTDTLSRIKQFRDKYCNPKDNGHGLALLCPNETDADMQNRDIDYTRTVDMPLTLDVNLTDNETTDDEETIFALIDYLFMHDPIPRVPKDALKLQKYQYHYQNLRSIVAMRGVARNSVANIIALKSASPEQASQSGPYLKALMKEMGLAEDEVEKLLGENPSYYAQMEFLTKTIYQNPSFYSNLYDKPANVKRIRAAMKAIKLMNDRDIHMALVRREMLLSMMLELRLRERAGLVYDATENALFKEN